MHPTSISYLIASVLVFSACQCPFSICTKEQIKNNEHSKKEPSIGKKVIIKITTSEEFEKNVTKATKPVVAKFGAKWCGACRVIEPTMETLADELGEEYTFVDIDVDYVREIAQKLNIRGIPTIIFFKNGTETDEKDRIIGAIHEEEFRKKIEGVFK